MPCGPPQSHPVPIPPLAQSCAHFSRPSSYDRSTSFLRLPGTAGQRHPTRRTSGPQSRDTLLRRAWPVTVTRAFWAVRGLFGTPGESVSGESEDLTQGPSTRTWHEDLARGPGTRSQHEDPAPRRAPRPSKHDGRATTAGHAGGDVRARPSATPGRAKAQAGHGPRPRRRTPWRGSAPPPSETGPFRRGSGLPPSEASSWAWDRGPCPWRRALGVGRDPGPRRRAPRPGIGTRPRRRALGVDRRALPGERGA